MKKTAASFTKNHGNLALYAKEKKKKGVTGGY